MSIRSILLVLGCVTIAFLYVRAPGVLGLFLVGAMCAWLGVAISSAVRRKPIFTVIGHLLMFVGLGVSSAALLLGKHQYILLALLVFVVAVAAFNRPRWAKREATFLHEGDTIRCSACGSIEVVAAGSTYWDDPLTMPFGGPTTKRPVFRCVQCGNIGTVRHQPQR